MKHFGLVHLNYFILAGIGITMLVFLWKKWDYFSAACSDKGVPSATRAGGMVLIFVVAFNELYTTLRTQVFAIEHLKLLLLAIAVCWGFVKLIDLATIWKGGTLPPSDPSRNKDNGTQTSNPTDR